MIELLTGAWDAFLHVVQTSPAELWPLLLALVGSITLTQVAKRLAIPATWSDLRKARASQLVAVVTGFAISAIVMPTRAVLVAGFIIGAMSPFVYFVGVRVIGMKWPATREWLSNS